MNPWALVLIVLGLGILVIGVKGTQDRALAALLGHEKKKKR